MLRLNTLLRKIKNIWSFFNNLFNPSIPTLRFESLLEILEKLHRKNISKIIPNDLKFISGRT